MYDYLKCFDIHLFSLLFKQNIKWKHFRLKNTYFSTICTLLSFYVCFKKDVENRTGKVSGSINISYFDGVFGEETISKKNSKNYSQGKMEFLSQVRPSPNEPPQICHCFQCRKPYCLCFTSISLSLL